MGSFGDAINFMNIKTQDTTHTATAGESAIGSTFEQPFVLVLAASEEALRAIMDSLTTAGLDPGRTNVVKIPSRYRNEDAPFRSADAHLGLGRYDDMFELLW